MSQFAAICPVCRQPSALFETCRKCIDSATTIDSSTLMSGFANSSIQTDKLTVDLGRRTLNRIPHEDGR